MIQQRVIQAFEEERARSKLPGYVPSYDDFEPEEVGAAVSDIDRCPAHAQVQGAEKPHGPHKSPAPQPQGSRGTIITASGRGFSSSAWPGPLSLWDVLRFQSCSACCRNPTLGVGWCYGCR